MFIGGKCNASMYHVKVKLKLFFCSVPLNPQLEDLLLRMLIKDPIERITIKGIKVGKLVVKKSSYNQMAKGYSVTHDGTQIISVMRDQAQISRVRRDWA